MHSLGYLHSDIKPDNILIGPTNKLGIIHLIDFGFSIKFHDGFDHIEFAKVKSF